MSGQIKTIPAQKAKSATIMGEVAALAIHADFIIVIHGFLQKRAIKKAARMERPSIVEVVSGYFIQPRFMPI